MDYEKKIQKVNKAIQRKFRLARRGEDNLPWGALRHSNRFHLAELFGDLKFNEGVEVGVRRGLYSAKLCKQNPDLHLTCVDPWDNYHFRYPQEKQDKIHDIAAKRLKPYNVTILRKSSVEGLAHFKDESIDFVFVDGNHKFDYVMTDIIEWSKKVKTGGIVAVHDYYHFGWAGVVMAVDAYTRAHHIDPWYTTKEREPTAVWVKRQGEPPVNNT